VERNKLSPGTLPTPLRRATRRPPRQGGTALSRPSRPAWPLSLLFGLGDHMHAYRICVHAILTTNSVFGLIWPLIMATQEPNLCAWNPRVFGSRDHINLSSWVINLSSWVKYGRVADFLLDVHISLFSRALSVGSAHRPPRLCHERKADGLFSSPPPIPYSSAVSVAAPCLGAPGCHGSPHIRPRGPRFSFVN